MQPIVCLDPGFSETATSAFGWMQAGRRVTVTDPDALKPALDAIAAEAAMGHYVVFTLAFEACAVLMSMPDGFQMRHTASPLLEALVFDTPPEPISVNPSIALHEMPRWSPPDATQYATAFAEIQDAITAGVCYQINHTFRLHGQYAGDPWALYQWLCGTQPALYGGYLQMDHHQVLSRSPELFVKKRGTHLRSEPMKGTAQRFADPVQDQNALDTLRNDPKMQAENLMIVDLIRNDLSKVATAKSVHVPELFATRSLKSVHQISSVVDARLADGVGLSQLLEALFPCGSVVGAPKAKALELIQQLESDPRGLYTGSLGYLEPNGDLTLSVAIRTLELHGQQAVLGLGSGLVADSELDAEWAECLLKGRFAGVQFDP